MWHIMHISIERQNSDVETICLRRKLEERVDFDGPHAEGVRGEGLSGRVDDVITKRHPDVSGLRSRHAMTSCDHVPAGDERPAAPGNFEIGTVRFNYED